MLVSDLRGLSEMILVNPYTHSMCFSTGANPSKEPRAHAGKGVGLRPSCRRVSKFYAVRYGYISLLYDIPPS